MSSTKPDPFSYTDFDAQSEADAILSNLRALRDQIVTAWRERAVVLSREEQVRLHAEVKQTCEFLTQLTRSK
ncbi:hypothetical protein [Sphingomonas arenae]|uniref:hypothetical protein n=1 Tax=Sphingomonas arenae TaxID=2812555 RepID=UPI001966EFB0|nr:hypothetical protein [Sphingomonas arenae]